MGNCSIISSNACEQLEQFLGVFYTRFSKPRLKFLRQMLYGTHIVETPCAERSPCIDAGLCAPWMKTATDLDGKARVKHVFPSGKARVDIGSYESAYWPIGLMLMVK